MKKVLSFIGILAIVLVAGYGIWSVSQRSADEGQPQGDDTLVVGATIFPLYDIAKSIGGDDVTVKQVLPSGVSPHTFEITPGVIRNLQDVDVFYAIGHELDNWVLELANTTGAEVVTVDDGIELFPFHEDESHFVGDGIDHNLYEREVGHAEDEHEHDDHHDEDTHDGEHGHDEDEHEHESEEPEFDDPGLKVLNHESVAHLEVEGDHHGHHHGDFDPHYWLSPINGVNIAQAIATDMNERTNGKYPGIMDRLGPVTAPFVQKNIEWQTAFAALSQRSFATFHNAFGYLAREYNLEIAATFEPFPGKEPTPQYLAALQNTLKERGVTVLFLEPQLSSDAVASFAKDNNLTLGLLDPLGGVEGRMTYLDLLEYNVTALLEALQ